MPDSSRLATPPTRASGYAAAEHTRGLIMAVTGILVLSPDTLVIRLIEADPATLLWWRGVFMFTGLAIYLTLRHRGRPRAAVCAVPRLGWLSAALFAVSTILFVGSVTLTTVANTLVIVASAPLFAAIFSRLFLSEPVPLATWICVGVGIAAVGVIFAGNHGVGVPLSEGALWGDLMAVGSAILLAAHFVNARHARAVSLMPPLALSGLLVAAAVSPFASPLDVGLGDFAWLVLLGLFIMPLAFGLLSEAPRYMPAAEVSLIILLETALGPLWVWLVLAEVPDPWTLIGGALLVATLVAHGVMGLRGSRGG